MNDDAAFLDYHIRWRAGGARPGKHAARSSGQGGDFNGCVPFWQLPDAARIDVRRSIMDPAGGLLVRQMRRRSAIDVIVAVDVSRSMGGLSDVAFLASAACRAALKAGDRFGLLAFDSRVREDLFLPPGRVRGVCTAAIEALSRHVPAGRSADGIGGLAPFLPSARSLVILVSDFLFSGDVLERGLQELAGHDSAAIVLHRKCAEMPGRSGILRIRDAESGKTRLIWVRRHSRRGADRAAAARRAQLDRVFTTYGRAPLHVFGKIDIGAVSQHLLMG